MSDSMPLSLLNQDNNGKATIADMYDRDRMDSEFPLVRAAHERNDETLERMALIIVSATQTKQAWFQGIRSPCGTRLSSSIVRVNHQ
jgi:hypothetical protein